MTKENQEKQKLTAYYEARFAMFGEQGWKDLVADMESMLEARNTLDTVTNEKELAFAKGELSIMRWILSLQEISEQTYENLKETGDI